MAYPCISMSLINDFSQHIVSQDQQQEKWYTVNDTWLTSIGQFEIKTNKSVQHFDQFSVIIKFKSENKIMHKYTKQRSNSMQIMKCTNLSVLYFDTLNTFISFFYTVLYIILSSLLSLIMNGVRSKHHSLLLSVFTSTCF